MGQINEAVRKWKERSVNHKEEGGKSHKDSFIILALLGILLLIVFMPAGSGADKKNEKVHSEGVLSDGKENNIEGTQATAADGTVASDCGMQDYAGVMERRLEETLSCMEGAGRVKVMITLASTEEAVVEKDTPVTRSNTEEADSQGGSRRVDEYTGGETTIYGTDGSGGNTPYVVKRLEPEIEGVVVIAQGGGDAKLCKNITEAIQALFGIEAHKIKVVKMKITS